jgi:hypothetical protein
MPSGYLIFCLFFNIAGLFIRYREVGLQIVREKTAGKANGFFWPSGDAQEKTACPTKGQIRTMGQDTDDPAIKKPSGSSG